MDKTIELVNGTFIEGEPVNSTSIVLLSPIATRTCSVLFINQG